MTASLAAVLLAVALQGGPTRYSVGLYCEGRYVDAPTPPNGGSVEVDPRVELEHEERGALASLLYDPRLVTGRTSGGLQVLQQGSLSGALQLERRVRFTATVAGSYGTNDLRLLDPNAASRPLQPLPAQTIIQYMSLRGQLGVEAALSPNQQLDLSAWYLEQGGADAPSREAVPLQHSPAFSGKLVSILNSNDSLITSANGSYSTFSVGSRIWVAWLLESWQRVFDARTKGQVGVGVGMTENSGVRSPTWAGEASIDHVVRSAPFRLAGGVWVGPFVDFTNGVSYPRTDGFGQATWTPIPTLAVSGRVNGGVAIGGAQQGELVAAGQLLTSWNVWRRVAFTAGLRGQWQRAGPTPPAAPFHQWSAFVGTALTQGDEL